MISFLVSLGCSYFLRALVSSVRCFLLAASAVGLEVSSEFHVKRYLNFTRQISHKWEHFGIHPIPSHHLHLFSIPFLIVFAELLTGTRSGFPVNSDSMLHREPFMQLLCFAYVIATQIS